jgi:hypothetical protein
MLFIAGRIGCASRASPVSTGGGSLAAARAASLTPRRRLEYFCFTHEILFYSRREMC